MRCALKIIYPNRDKASSRATRAAVIALCAISVALVLAISLGGWNEISGGQIFQLGFAAIFLVLAYFIVRWKRGALPIAAAFSTALLALAIVGAPGWFDRSNTGFDPPPIDAEILGMLTVLLIPVQLLLIAFSLRGFSQGWNVELEIKAGEDARRSISPYH